MNIPILYEDDQLLVVDKPAGITVNNSETTIHEETVQDWAVKHIGISEGKSHPAAADTDDTVEEDTYDYKKLFVERGGIVHRLDKETSGILLIAKTPESFFSLQQQFKERVVKKWYHALVHGKVTPDSGEINVPVGRLPWNRRQFGIVAGGRESVTFYHVVDYYQLKTKQKEIVSLLELEPKTGRTHQIRVHVKYLNHPIFADFLYAGRKTAQADRKLLSRVFLHAAKIMFIHPTSKKELIFTSPLPDELQGFIDTNCTMLL